MKVLAIEKALEQELGKVSLLVEEAQRVYELYKMDKIREIYFQKYNHCAVIVFEVSDINEARTLIKTLALVASQVITSI